MKSMCVKTQQNNWMYWFIVFKELHFYGSRLYSKMLHLAIFKVFIVGR